jgi:uncharacterized membrane protein
MQDTLLSFFEPLKNLNPIIYIMIIAFVPLIELRGSIPIAIGMGVPATTAFFWSIIGSILPAFFVIPLFHFALNFLEKKGWFPRLTNFLHRKFDHKVQKTTTQNDTIAQSDKSIWHKTLLKFWSIAIFVGIPLPGTGVWTGSGVASLIKMPFLQAFAAVLIGDLIAAIIVTAISLGLFSLF